MTPKEKASELTNKFYCKTDSIGLSFCLNYSNAKQCALIAVDEILNAHLFDLDEKQYWQQVKTEIQSL